MKTKMRQKHKITIALLVLSLFISQTSFAGSLEKNSKEITHTIGNLDLPNTSVDLATKKPYLPYLQIGGTHFFNVGSHRNAAGLDFFIPLWQPTKSHLLYSHIRLHSHTIDHFEGNVHLGYRHLSLKNNHMYGIYAAFDRKHSLFKNYFNQITIGVEAWLNRLFIGGNFYQPIGKITSSTISAKDMITVKDAKHGYNIWVTKFNDEKAMSGADLEVGYEFTKNITGYIGGYYFHAKDTDTITGPKAKLSYDFSLSNGKRVLGIFDKVGLEVGVRHDKPRGTVGYINLSLKIGLTSNKHQKLEGVAKHMVDLVRRDVDIVSQVRKNRTQIKVEAFPVDSTSNLQYIEMNQLAKKTEIFGVPTKEITQKIELEQEKFKHVIETDKQSWSTWFSDKTGYSQLKKQWDGLSPWTKTTIKVAGVVVTVAGVAYFTYDYWSPLFETQVVNNQLMEYPPIDNPIVSSGTTISPEVFKNIKSFIGETAPGETFEITHPNHPDFRIFGENNSGIISGIIKSGRNTLHFTQTGQNTFVAKPASPPITKGQITGLPKTGNQVIPNNPKTPLFRGIGNQRTDIGVPQPKISTPHGVICNTGATQQYTGGASADLINQTNPKPTKHGPGCTCFKCEQWEV